VYYKDMPFYGYCVPENVVLEGLSPVPVGTASAWIVVENDFAGFVRNDEDVTGSRTVRTGALKVTQAHEFMHALQFNINVYQSGWLFESHATWAEDAVYDRVNDWHWYINSFFRTPALPVQNRYVYGSAYFMNWLSETYGVDAPRRVWEASRTATAIEAVRAPPSAAPSTRSRRSPPAQIALGINDFDGSEGTSSVQPNPALLLRARHAAYPVSVTVPPSTAKVPNGAPSGLGSNFVEFTPAAGAASSDLTLTFDGADGPQWRAYAVVTGRRGVTTVPIALDGGAAGSYVVRDFGGGVTRVVLAVTIADRAGCRCPTPTAPRSAAPSPRASQVTAFRSAARRHLFTMVASIVALDAVAVGLYYFAGIRDADGGVRNAFTIAWTVATLAVVALGLRRIREERRRG
jgi:hypothetical protein